MPSKTFAVLLLGALSLAGCRSAELDVGENGGQDPHPLLTACENATFDLVVEQRGKQPLRASGSSLAGRIVFEVPGVLDLQTAKPVTVTMTVTGIPPGGLVRECPFSPGDVRKGRSIPLKWLGNNRFGIDLEDLRKP